MLNEAIESDGSWRKSPFYEILGEEYIPLIFQYAHEADPEAELYYNDYGMDGKAKRDKVVELVKMLKDRGLRIDAVGMQGHMGMDYPSVSNLKPVYWHLQLPGKGDGNRMGYECIAHGTDGSQYFGHGVL